jgi:hypothetical protein
MEKQGVVAMRKMGPKASRPGSTPVPPDQSPVLLVGLFTTVIVLLMNAAVFSTNSLKI